MSEYKTTMDIDRAREVVAEVIDMRKKWGIQVSSRDFSQDDLLDALMVLQAEGVETANALVAKANRQQGAYKAQLAKAEKAKERLRETIAEMQTSIDGQASALADMSKQLKSEQARHDATKAELAAAESDLVVLRSEQEDLP